MDFATYDEVSLIDLTPDIYSIAFYNSKGEEVGRIEWNDGTMKFTGDAEASAQEFFKFLKQYIDQQLNK